MRASRRRHPGGCALAEIGLDDAGIAGNRLRRAFGDDAALRQHEDMPGQAHHRLHDVLDHDDGDAAIADGEDHRHHIANLGRVEPRQHLVEQEQPRLDRQRAGKLEALSSRNRKARRRTVERRIQPDRAGDVAGGVERIRARGPRQVSADRDVFPHRQAYERLHDLEGAGDAAARQPMRRHAGDVGAIIDDAALTRRQESGDDREQRGLACAVRPISAVIWPALAVSDAPSTASRPPKRLETFSTRSRGSVTATPPWTGQPAAQVNEDAGDATRREGNDNNQHAAVDDEIEARAPPVTSLVNSPSVLTTSAPSSGPNTVPMPPMIGASSPSIEIHGP